ncbi:MAG: hypothetical protein LKJ25_10560 [Clostridia bacterium]|jgi:hypothetical protein|nr:hypothetical protein [Clostridia bacterium]MCI2000351.1 hypothetical protein [Clostridia bacterium]MCI2015531.1 hypothetical protein [Clostridia bacterium]
MINFNEEIKKYEQILELDDIEDAIHSTDLKDIMDMLNYIALQSGPENNIRSRSQ